MMEQTESKQLSEMGFSNSVRSSEHIGLVPLSLEGLILPLSPSRLLDLSQFIPLGEAVV